MVTITVVKFYITGSIKLGSTKLVELTIKIK
jgi:hypothetical protein